MTKSSVRLVSDNPPPRSPEREALADAIQRHAAATQRIADIEAVLLRVSSELFGDLGHYRAAERAKQAHKDAEAGAERWLADAALSGADASVPPAQKAAAALEQANAALDHARRTRAALEQQQQEAERELSVATSRREDALREAVKSDPAMQRLIADHVVALRTYTNLRRAMEFLGALYLPATAQFWRHAEAWPELPGAAPWQQALKALEADADAPLPPS